MNQINSNGISFLLLDIVSDKIFKFSGVTTNLLTLIFTVFKQNQSRYRVNKIFLCSLLVLIQIYSEEYGFALMFYDKLLQVWFDDFTISTPFGCKISENWEVSGIDKFLFKGFESVDLFESGR